MINKNYVVGFIEGEGCFSFMSGKTVSGKYRCVPTFTIISHKQDKEILLKIQDFFGGAGYIYSIKAKKKNNVGSLNENTIQYRVTSRKDLPIIIHKLGDNPFMCTKKEIYEGWKKVVYMFKNNEHLTKVGSKKIFKIRDDVRFYKKKGRKPKIKWQKD